MKCTSKYIYYEKVIFQSGINEEWIVKVAKTVQEAIELVGVRADYVIEMIDNGRSVKIFRKRK